MMGWSSFYKNLLPLIALISMEGVDVGLNTLFKAATMKGMSNHVFVVYDYAIATLVLVPPTLFTLRSSELPPLSFPILCKIGLLGLIGGSSKMMGYAGINISSPALASAMSNLTPAFTFILAIIFRMEKIALKEASSQAKVLGTIVSISGAFLVVFYKGPPVLLDSKPALHSSQPNWVFGGMFLATEYFMFPLWNIVMTQIMKDYPAEIPVVCIYNLCVTFIAVVVGLFTESDSSAWRIRSNIAIASIICTGLFNSCLINIVHAWALHLKGPVYVAMFMPLSIAIAVFAGVIFLGDTLHLGSLVGAVIISIGFYTLMWGKAKEERSEECVAGSCSLSASPNKEPLLESHTSKQLV